MLQKHVPERQQHKKPRCMAMFNVFLTTGTNECHVDVSTKQT